MDLEYQMGAAIDAVQKLIAALKETPGADPRQVAFARTQFETAFLWAAFAADGKSILDV